ncbi:MAG: pilus assembly protein TadG-related protein [Tepidisphaeraceae bacterium]
MVYALMIFTALGGIVSLAVDYGHVQLVKTELQRAADAAARAALTDLPSGVTTARNTAVTVAGTNTADSTAVALNTSSDIEFGTWDIPTRTFTVSAVGSEASANAIRITARSHGGPGECGFAVFRATRGDQ